MICPQTKAECGLELCKNFDCLKEAHKPTLAEIESRLDDYVRSIRRGNSDLKQADCHAALMAAIRAYGEG